MDRCLVRWDIDGMLLTTGPAGRLALGARAPAATGPEWVRQVDMGGKTGPQILREALAAAGDRDADIGAAVPAALEEAR